MADQVKQPVETCKVPDLVLYNLIEQYQELLEEEKRLSKFKDEKKQKILELIGDAETVEVGKFIVNNKTIVTTSLDVKAVKQEAPDIYNSFLKVTESKRLTIKEKEI